MGINFLDIIVASAALFGVLYASFQYKHSIKHKQLEKAAELAKEYQAEFLFPIGLIASSVDFYISNNFRNISKSYYRLIECYKGIHIDKTTDSMKIILPIYEEFDGEEAVIDFSQCLKEIILKLDSITISNFNIEEFKSIFDDNERKVFEKLFSLNILDFEDPNKKISISELCSDLSNKLEYFCMYFNSKLADETAVYQSLHQTFLQVIPLLYYKIATANNSNHDKFFVHLIEQYNRWSNKRKYLMKKESKKNWYDILSNIITKFQNKSNMTKGIEKGRKL
jgi:hypothetical protein